MALLYMAESILGNQPASVRRPDADRRANRRINAFAAACAHTKLMTHRLGMDPLPNRNIDRVRHLFDSEHLSLVIDAVGAGNTPARVWVDGITAPRAALIWDGSHSVYLAGSMERAGEWRNLFDREVAPAGNGVLKAYVTDVAAETVFAGYPLQRRERVLLRGGRQSIPHWRTRLPTGFRISVIDDRLTARDTLANADDVIAEVESC
jgi:hypothetical protein